MFPPPQFLPQDVPPEADGAGWGEGSRQTIEPQICYICKYPYSQIHHFYDRLCPACADLNFVKRTELADLRGRVALLTGGRVKIGYQAGLKLLRAGAHLIVTTRFPRDSAARYAREPDFDAREVEGNQARRLDLCFALASAPHQLRFFAPPSPSGVLIFPPGVYTVSVQVTADNLKPTTREFDVDFTAGWDRIVIAESNRAA